METNSTFTMKTYGWQELAILYSPDVTNTAASRRLKKWVHRHPNLVHELTDLGWNVSNRVLTPLQVEAIIRYLGTP